MAINAPLAVSARFPVETVCGAMSNHAVQFFFPFLSRGLSEPLDRSLPSAYNLLVVGRSRLRVRSEALRVGIICLCGLSGEFSGFAALLVYQWKGTTGSGAC